MSHGLIIRNAGNTVILDTSGYSIRTFYTQVLDQSQIPDRPGIFFVSIPGITPDNATAWLNYDASVPSYISIPYCEVETGGVRIYGKGQPGYNMRLYVAGLS